MGRNFFIRLERGEDVFEALKDFSVKNDVKSASFTALGAVEDGELGYYSLEEKKYHSKQYADAMEVVSMTGNIALVDGMPFVHAHAVLSDTENTCAGGHLFAARVAVTLEIHLCVYDAAIERTLDNEVGLKLLDL